MSEKQSTVLIVDDDKAVIEQLTLHFRRRGYEPIATANPTTVDTTVQNFDVHLMLLDLRMERLNGYDVLKKLQEKNVRVPVLIITAYFQDEKERLRAAGIPEEDVIEKPFRDFAKIEAMISRKLGKAFAGTDEGGSDFKDRIYLGNRTIVAVVDDEPEINSFIKDVLEARRYRIRTFTRGDEALQFILRNECHVVIVDMQIPALRGDQLIQQALRAKPSLKIVPVSGGYPEGMETLLKNIGFDSKKLVTKPFKLPELVEQVRVLAQEAGTLGRAG